MRPCQPSSISLLSTLASENVSLNSSFRLSTIISSKAYYASLRQLPISNVSLKSLRPFNHSESESFSRLHRLNSRRSLRGRGFDSETQGSSLPSSANSRSAYMPDFRSNPDARSANANGDIPVPLSNLKASLSWTDRTTSDKVSTDSGSGSAFPPAHGYRDKEQYQGVVDIAVPPMNDRDGRPHPFSVRIILFAI